MKAKDILILVLVLILALLIAFYFNKKTDFIWEKTFNNTKKQPYDFGVFNELILQKKETYSITKEKPNFDKLVTKKNEIKTYVFIGRHCYLTKNEQKTIINFAKKGNYVLFISETLPQNFLDTLLQNEFDTMIHKFYDYKVAVKNESMRNLAKFRYRFNNNDSFTKINFNFLKPKYYLIEDFENDELKYEQDESKEIEILGYVNNEINFIKKPIGNGAIFFNTTPLLFTNYFLKDNSGYQYLNFCLNNLPENPIILDQYSQEYKKNTQQLFSQNKTPLSFILSKPALRWAWYLLIFGAILFLIFGLKRKQKSIPPIETRENTSENFIKSISALFLRKTSFSAMGSYKMQQFNLFLKTKLNINYKEYDDNTIEHISKISKVEINVISNIFKKQKQHLKGEVLHLNKKDLIELNQLINTFYKHYRNKK